MGARSAHASFLLSLAGRLASHHVDHCGARAALVAGSVAEGVCDEWSDIDLILFYDVLPSAEALARAMAALGGSARYVLGGDPEAGVLLEQYRVEGVACQLVHQTFDAWRTQAESILVDLDVDSPSQKALAGLHEGVVLNGAERIEELRSVAAYPDALSQAMVERHVDVFPLWRLHDSLARRDALLFQHAELVAGFHQVLAILAGLNRRFFSTFQLKKVARLVASFDHAPDDLAARIDAALTAPPDVAARSLRAVVVETVALLEAQMPAAEIGPLRASLGPPLTPWELPQS